MGGEAPFLTRSFYFELYLVRVVHNSVPCETLFHGKRFATARVLTHKWTHFFMEGEDVALQIKYSGVGPPTAFPRTAIYVPRRGVSLHVLLKVIFALKRFLAYFTGCYLFMGFSCVFQELCPCFGHKGTSLLTRVTLMDLGVPLQPAGGGEVFPTSLLGTLEGWLVGVLALMRLQLLVFPEGLLTALKAAYILLLLIFMFAFKMFLQVRFCVELLITVTSCADKRLFSSMNQCVATQMVVPDEGLATALVVTNKWSLPRVLAQVRV